MSEHDVLEETTQETLVGGKSVEKPDYTERPLVDTAAVQTPKPDLTMRGEFRSAIVVGLPTFGMVDSDVMLNIMQMTYPVNMAPYHMIVKGQHIPLDEACNMIVERALEINAKYVYFREDDVLTPPGTLERLMAFDVDIITGVCMAKQKPPYPIVFREWGGGSYTDWYDKPGIPVQVVGTGMGAMLVKTEVFREMEKPWFRCVHMPTTFGTEYRVSRMTQDLYFCFAPGTKVFGQGVKNIEDVQIGDKVLTHRGRLRKVTHKFERPYEGELVKIEADFDVPIVCTPNHKFWVSRIQYSGKSHELEGYDGVSHEVSEQTRKLEWVAASDLRLTDEIHHHYYVQSQDSKRNFFTSTLVDQTSGEVDKDIQTNTLLRKGTADEIPMILKSTDADLMRLFGYFLAEGHTTDFTVVFSVSEEETSVIMDIKQLMLEKFSLVGKQHKPNPDEKGIQLHFPSKLLASMFSNLFGSLAPNKKMPDWFTHIYQKESLGELLKGLWVGDGSYERSRSDQEEVAAVVFATTSEQLAYQIKLVLSRFKILASVKHYDNYRGFTTLNCAVPEEANRMYKVYVPRTYNQQVDAILGVGNGLKVGLEGKSLLEATNCIFRRFKNHCFVKIRNLSRVPYQGLVYNLEVEEDNTYQVHGLSAHNCMKAIDYGYQLWVDTGSLCAHKDVTTGDVFYFDPIRKCPAWTDSNGQSHFPTAEKWNTSIPPLTAKEKKAAYLHFLPRAAQEIYGQDSVVVEDTEDSLTITVQKAEDWVDENVPELDVSDAAKYQAGGLFHSYGTAEHVIAADSVSLNNESPPDTSTEEVSLDNNQGG